MSRHSKKLYLSILWHQHQPCYKSGVDGVYHMPWVFLHGMKDYAEMARHVIDASTSGNIKVNFNYVPSLLKQLKDYENVHVNDIFIKLLKKPVHELIVTERRVLIAQLMMINKKNMVSRSYRLEAIFEKQQKGIELSGQELLDFSVLYLLEWTGEFDRLDPYVKSLIYKCENFSEADKTSLLNLYAEKIKNIVTLHKQLMQSGVAEISFTPFYHPIMPLLADFSSAKEAMPSSPMPELATDFGEDYKVHLDRGYDYHTSVFGKEPEGVWPSEGSVSPVTVDAYIKKGLKWVATDEDILARTIKTGLKRFPYRAELYKMHVYKNDTGSINIFFRDKTLSDLIGFTYSSWEPHNAVKHFLERLKEIYEECPFSPHVSVILDGENAWEYYRDNAFDFFKEFYSVLAKQDWLEMETFSSACKTENNATPVSTLSTLASGSWINGNFAIWCGHHEKNLAWELLSQTRKFLIEQKDKVSADKFNEAYEMLLTAEGSDWFWWFGDDHSTEQSMLFDELFRSYLIGTYQKLGVKPPQKLYNVIKRSVKTGLLMKNFRNLSVQLDGKNSFYTEWLGAGLFDLTYDEGAMHSAGSLLKLLRFGYDDSYFYFNIECEPGVILPGHFKFGININELNYTVDVSKGTLCESLGLKVFAGTIIEGSIPLSLMFKEGESVQLYFSIDSEGSSQRAPRYNGIKFVHPSLEPPDWAV